MTGQNTRQIMEMEQKLFIQYMREHKGIIYKICNSYCTNKDDRDDLAQDIIYNLWKSFKSFNPDFKFSTWMYRIALNVAISFYRQDKKFKYLDAVSEELIVFEESIETKQDETKNLALLQSFINDLKEIDKAIILLYLDDKSHKEISEITGFTETNVATKINRIKEKIRLKFINN